MTFDIADALRLVNPVTLAVSVLAGVTLSTVLRAVGVSGRTPWPLFTTLAVIGMSFIAMLGATRLTQGVTTWEAYIGMGVLWLVYSGAASVAMKVRVRRRPPL